MTLFARAVSVYALVFTALFSIHALAQPPKPVGTVLFVHGDVAIVSSAGERRSAERGASVYEGDKIISSAASSMQIKMVDSGYLAIRPSTEIRIDKYQFDQSQNDKAETSLLRGGLRSITGSIGKTRKENFKLRTPVATIGIRGTDLEVFYVPSSRNELLAKGAYLRINSGKGYLQTFAGVQFVNPNQTGFVGSSQSAPQILKTAPEIFNQPEQDFLPEEKNVSGNADVSESDGSTGNDNNPVAGKGRDNKGDADQVADVFEESDSPQPVKDDASFTESEEELVDLALPPDLQESWNSDSDASPEPELNVPTEDIEFGVIGDATPETTVAAQTGVFNYSVSSTGLGVSEGTLNTAGSSTKLNIDFDNDLVIYDLQLDFSSPAGVRPAAVSGDNGGMWIFSGSGALGDFTGDSGLTLAGAYSENETSQSAKGKWYGFFTGGNADGLFSSFELESGNYSVFGFVESSTRASTDYLAGLELLSGVNGYILNGTAVNPLSDYTLYQGGNGLTALENPTTGEQWVAASTATTGTTLGDATVTWGSWNTWRQINGQALIEHSTPIQYIHSNQLTDAAIPANLQGIYHFNAVNGIAQDGAGAQGSLSNGHLSIDFTNQQADLGLNGSLGNDSWSAYGTGSLSNLYAGQFALSGDRYDGVTTESLSGTAQGQFAGSNADGLFGFYQLEGSKSQINGVYAFEKRRLNGYLAKMTALSGINGYVLNGNTVNPLSNYTLYQDGNGFSALVNPVTGEQKVLASGVSSEILLGDATVTWGSWNTWRQINDQTLIEYSTPIQYIHSNQLTDAAIPANLQGIYHFNALRGQAYDQAGMNGGLVSGNLSVDFTQQNASLDMSGLLGTDTWGAYGSDSLTNLYSGNFALTGSRFDGVTAENLSGTAQGQFAGSNADGLFGYYHLAGSSSQINGVYAFGDRQLNDYLAKMTLLNGVSGYVLNGTAVNPLSDYTLYQGGNGLAALENPTTGEQWVAASTATSGTTLGDATVAWGSWNTWRQINDQTLIEQTTPIQYIHSNQLTDAAIPANLQGIYHFNSLGGQAYDQAGANGGLVSGNLSVDFTQQNASLDMSGLLGTDTWGAYGSDSLTNLYSGNFALTGSRYDGVTAESLSGTAQGQFAGSNADGLFGYYQLAGSKSQIEGVYAFGDRQLNDYLAKMTLLNGVNGYVLNGTTVNPLSGYTLYQGGNGLAALENPTTGEQWVASSTATSGSTLGDATVTWGSWNTWHQINDQALIEQTTPIQYIHSNQLTDAAIPANLQGIYHFNAVNGIAQDSAGAQGSLSNGHLSIDFTNQQADLGLNGSLGNDSWSAYGTDSLSNLYAGQFALNGDRYDGVTAESLSGTAQGQFAGSNAGGLFGYYQLTGSKSQIEGVYAFGDRQLNDYLAKMTLLYGVNGYVLNGTTVNPLSSYTLYQGGNGLAALENPTTGEQWVADSTATSGTTLGDATVTWGSWNTWRQINDQTLIEHSTPIQYIYTDVLTDSSIVANHENVFSLTSVGGSAHNQSGELSQAITSSMTIDFIDQDVDIALELAFSDSQWAMSGSGLISEVTGSGMALIGERYDATERVYESADGVVIGDFFGSGLEGLTGFYQLSSATDFADGSLVLAKDLQLNEKRVLSGNHLAFFSDTQTGFYGASDQGAVFTALDGNLLRVAKDGVTTEAQGSDVLFGATASSALNQINWGYWDGFVVGEGTNAEQYFDQKRYFGLIDSTSLHTFSSAGRANMQAKFSLLGAVGHDINGTQLTFDQANSYLMLDFNTSVMSGQLEMTAGSVDGDHDRWSLYTGYYSLNDIVSGEGSVTLYGDVLSLDAQGSQIGSGYVDGYWDFVWSGDRSDILMGGFNVWELSEIGPGNYASSGLVVFSDPSAQNVVLEGSEFSGLVSGFSDGLGWEVGFVFDSASSNSLSGYYVSESDPRYLVGAFNDNQGVSINSSSAQLFEDTSSYEVLGDSYGGQADGVYSVAGSNVILDADSANAANVQWGRWGAQADDDILFGNGEGIGSLDVLHYITTDVATPASALEGLINDYAYASFSFAGGTAPTLTKRDITDEVKVELGSVDFMELNVDFGYGYVDTYMELSFTRGSISALGSGDLVSFTSGGIDTQVYESGEIPVGRGTLEGIFVGPNADGAIISYDMNTEFGEINGAAALQKTYQQSNAGQLP